MNILMDFINTVGLDKSFFVQLFLCVALYFIAKKLFLKAYLDNFERSEKLTKGRISSSKDLEEKIEKQKDLYEQKAKTIHVEFQKVFDEIRKQAQKKYQKDSFNIQTEQKDLIKNQRATLKKSLEEQELELQKELPLLKDLLVEKIKS